MLYSMPLFILFLGVFFLMIRRPPRSTHLTHSFPTRRSSDLIQEVSPGNFTHVDGLLANDADTTSLIHTADDIWDTAGSGSAAAASLLGGFVNSAQFNGLIGDQWKVLTAILAPGQSVLGDPESMNEPVNDGVDDGTKEFARVYSATVPGEANIPGAGNPIDRKSIVEGKSVSVR